jgi:hypothetical protein
MDEKNKEKRTTTFEISPAKFHKMMFLYNALQEGWSIKKQNQSYIFKKNHEGKREILDESYLDTFVEDMSLLLPKK